MLSRIFAGLVPVLLASALVFSIERSAQAHFVWLVQNTPAGGESSSDANQATTAAPPSVQLCFGESAAPGEAHLADKIAKTTKWLYLAGKNEPTELTWAKETTGSTACFAAAAPAKGDWRLEAACDYGVVARPNVAPFRLHYYAKTLHAPASEWATLAPAKQLALDILPELTGNELQLQVLWNGKPLENSTVTITVGTDQLEPKTTDATGHVRVKLGQHTGAVSALAKHEEPTAKAELDGKSYEKISHYSTLTLPVIAKNSTAIQPVSIKRDLTAPQLLQDARENRSLWPEYKSISGKAKLNFNGQPLETTFTISAQGVPQFKLDNEAASDWLEEYLTSMVQHRVSGSVSEEEVVYVDEKSPHPLGTKISLGDSDWNSYYRIKDRQILEVNRKMGPGRFTISVLDVYHNPEGKYLPAVFTFTIFDKEGKVKQSMTEHTTWARIDDCDLPLRTMRVETKDNPPQVNIVEFSDWKVEKAAK
ncbi:MAG: DUF3386 family protein [Pirellulales bacterium]|nr:DUF3386 family protein [Pirellulales bacterium]